VAASDRVLCYTSEAVELRSSVKIRVVLQHCQTTTRHIQARSELRRRVVIVRNWAFSACASVAWGMDTPSERNCAEYDRQHFRARTTASKDLM